MRLFTYHLNSIHPDIQEALADIEKYLLPYNIKLADEIKELDQFRETRDITVELIQIAETGKDIQFVEYTKNICI